MENVPELVTLELSNLWEQFFNVAPLVLIGSREADGSYNQAPKHMATPLGWSNFFAFVCTPAHRTYHNIQREQFYTVTYPRPSQVVLSSMTASARDDSGAKPALQMLATFPAQQLDGQFIAHGYLFLECRLLQVLDGFGTNSLILGEVVHARAHPDILRSGDRDEVELFQTAPLLAYIDPGRFARITEAHPFPFPRDFER